MNTAEKTNYELITLTHAAVYEVVDLYRDHLNGDLNDRQFDQLLDLRLDVQKRTTRWSSFDDEPYSDEYRVAVSRGGPNIWIEYVVNYATNTPQSVRVRGYWQCDEYTADHVLTTREKAALFWAFSYWIDIH